MNDRLTSSPLIQCQAGVDIGVRVCVCVCVKGVHGILITCAKAADLQFGNLLLIGELGTVNAGTRTAHFAQPHLPMDTRRQQTIRCLSIFYLGNLINLMQDP